ncbi:uncharacterized protein CEXT_781051 [Caerostris extrusa]|uniref:Uncharacterized protein n=1 Tax=Caerostris extrusa TaxID=172846 RepID=A0AAV4TPC6_CAEEX|nr:uncharacterized protein CEXT_781051 [Caerostris extrusa]
MGRITPQNETHYGDPGTFIMVDPEENTDFWDNSFLRTEHSSEILKRLRPNEISLTRAQDEIKVSSNPTEKDSSSQPPPKVLPPNRYTAMESYRNKFLDAIELIAEISYVMYKKLSNRQNEMGDQVDGIASEKDMFMDASREFLLHLYLNDEEVDEYNVRRKQCWEDEDPIKCKKI